MQQIGWIHVHQKLLSYRWHVHVNIIPSRYANLPCSLTNGGIGVLLSVMWSTSIQIVPPSATKYNSLKRADLYQDGNELQQKINHNGWLDHELENFIKWQLMPPKANQPSPSTNTKPDCSIYIGILVDVY